MNEAIPAETPDEIMNLARARLPIPLTEQQATVAIYAITDRYDKAVKEAFAASDALTKVWLEIALAEGKGLQFPPGGGTKAIEEDIKTRLYKMRLAMNSQEAKESRL